MEIYVLRHGIAEPRGAGVVDADRKLTAKGKQSLRAVLEAAKRAEVAPELILTSPLVRAQQTAALAAQLLECKRVVETEQLLPSGAPAELWKEIAGYKQVSRVLIAGHEPHLSQVIAFLLEASVTLDLKKGSLVRITTEPKGSPRGILKWFLTPRLATT